MQTTLVQTKLQCSDMKTRANGKPKRLELGEHIVADPLICHGKPTFKGTRIMVWQILDELADKIYAPLDSGCAGLEIFIG